MVWNSANGEQDKNRGHLGGGCSTYLITYVCIYIYTYIYTSRPTWFCSPCWSICLRNYTSACLWILYFPADWLVPQLFGISGLFFLKLWQDEISKMMAKHLSIDIISDFSWRADCAGMAFIYPAGPLPLRGRKDKSCTNSAGYDSSEG